MMKELGAMMNLLGNAGKLQEEMKRFQAALAQIAVQGSSPGGAITVRANGRLEILGVRIAEDAFKNTDKELFEDLLTAAINNALTKAKEAAAQESAKMASNMGLPAGMLSGLPGLG